MPGVFVDTAPWVALLNTRDELHHSAQRRSEVVGREHVQLIATDFVLVGLANICCGRLWRGLVSDLDVVSSLSAGETFWRHGLAAGDDSAAPGAFGAIDWQSGGE